MSWKFGPRSAFLVLVGSIGGLVDSARACPPGKPCEPEGQVSTLHSGGAADETFRQGRDAVKRGDYEGAYLLFRRSFGYDPTPGVVLNLADCEEHLGKLADALDHFNTAARSMASTDDRLPVIAARVKKLEPRVPRIAIPTVPGASDQTVLLDGTTLFSLPHDTTFLAGKTFTREEHRPFDTPIRINPGSHAVRWIVSIPNSLPVDFTQPVAVAEAENKALDVPPEVLQGANALAVTQHEDPELERRRQERIATAHADAAEALREAHASNDVQVHFAADPDDHWNLVNPRSGWLCQLPCDQRLDVSSSLLLRRENSSDIVHVSLIGNRPGTSLVVTPHKAGSMGPGFALMFSGIVVGVGAIVVPAVACNSGCPSGDSIAAGVIGVAGLAGFVTGLVLILTTNVVPRADIETGPAPAVPPSSLRIGPGWLGGTF